MSVLFENIKRNEIDVFIMLILAKHSSVIKIMSCNKFIYIRIHLKINTMGK